MRLYKIFFFILVLILLYIRLEAALSGNSIDLKDLDLEELMELRVDIGTLTGIEQAKFPGSIIILTEKDISQTPARNLLDLLEIYVPGAIYVMHYHGFRLGLRGMLSDQNYSYQLLINGKNLNLRAIYGPLFELQEKDLSNIEKIEIISGPGSAVYGPGATAGIINIITKKPADHKLSFFYENNLNYRYQTRSLQYSEVYDKIRFNFYGSMCRSKGLAETKLWYIDRAHNVDDNMPYGWGYMTPDWGNYGLGGNVPFLLGDYLDEPETKLNLDLEYGDNLSLVTRYSTYNHTFVTQNSFSEEGPAFAGHKAKYFTSDLKWDYDFSKKLSIVTRLGFQSKCLREINLYQRSDLPFEHIAQRGNSFSENNLNMQSIINYEIGDNYRFALGGEVAYEYYRPEWGLDQDTFILKFPAPIKFAVLNSNSGFYKYYGNEYATVIEEEIDGRMYSVFSEANLKFSDYFQVLLSSRLDKHEYSRKAFSPRFAVISQINDKNIVELILEKAVRMPPFTDLYALHYLGDDAAKPEVLQGAELDYRYFYNSAFEANLKSYYYLIDQIGWVSESQFTDLVGSYKLVGFEPELKYRGQKLLTGINYSFIRQLDWQSKLELDAWIQGLDGEEIYIEDNAENRINNFPAQAVKMFTSYNILHNVKFHLNGRLMWDYQQNDMLEKFAAAHQEYGNSETMEIMDQIIKDLHDHGYGKTSFTSNASVQWNLDNLDLSLQLYALNLISYNHIRYVIQFWETEGVRQYPRQCGFIEEPLTIGLNLRVNF